VAARGGIIKASQCREICSIRKKKEEEKVEKKRRTQGERSEESTSGPIHPYAKFGIFDWWGPYA
jgi:hypothetical protein